MKIKIASVIVLYHPADQVIETIRVLALDCSNVVVVSNSASDGFLSKVSEINSVALLNNRNNVGLATALNLGIQYAFEDCGADFVALLDQDSLPPPGLISSLVAEALEINNLKLACIGPKLVDKKAEGAAYVINNTQNNVSKPRSIPTSGSVISKEAFRIIGPMLEGLFIDGIDHEWCLRAYSKGYVVKVSDRLKMVHNMGDIGINFFGQFKPIHLSPVRHYYIIRNALYLSKLSYLPLRWRASELIKTVRRALVYLAISKDKPKTMRSIYLAVIDGLKGQLGPLDHLHPNLGFR
jgi:rhamnosyltransferase